MKILLVEPKKSKKYHTTYPPLGLLKLAVYHKRRGDFIRLVNGPQDDGYSPDLIYITSLFTYAWEPVHEVIRFYSKKYKRARIIVGGIYATLCSDHLMETFGDRIEIYKGIMEEIEDMLPDYSLVPQWKASIVFSSRGCIRKCPFCAVPVLEPIFKPKRSIRHLIYPGHKKVILWDNNILASPYWEDIFNELKELNLDVDFNQGLDARLLDEKIALKLRGLKIPLFRLAYDTNGVKNAVKGAIARLKGVGIRGRRILVYCLFNTPGDTPEGFLERIKNLLDWGVVAYPMRFEPLEPGPKNTYISPNWTPEQVEMVAKARRVLGYGGTFPPYEGLKKKILDAKDFEAAFILRPLKKGRKVFINSPPKHLRRN